MPVPRIAVLIVHGMGTQEPDFWRPLAGALQDRLGSRGIPDGSVAWCGAYWADILIEQEADILRRAREGGPLGFTGIREFVVNALGDAVAYRRMAPDANSVYLRIHERMRQTLASLRAELDADLPLVVMAHSLGSVIISDYIWDAQHRKARAPGDNPFECMQTLAGLITFGSNIPLFSLALPDIRAIAFPPPELDAAVAAAAEWHNYYDKDDVLGWPLKTLSDSYARVVDADHEINVGGILQWWNPASHGAYWEDRGFIHPAADQIERLLAVVR